MTGETRFTERSGLVDSQAAADRIASVHSARSIEQADLPLSIVATDFLTGESVVMSIGPVMEAIRASIATPIIFPPH